MLLLLLLMSADPRWNCAEPAAQQEMNYCAHQDYLKADTALNAQWKKTSAFMQERDTDRNLVDDGRPGHFASLLEAQRSWLKFRDAHCQVAGYLFRGGSMEPLIVSTCKARLTQERTEQLEFLIEQ